MTAELEDEKVIQVHGEDAFYVKSDSKDTYYRVKFEHGVFSNEIQIHTSCECPHYQYRLTICKHIRRVFDKVSKK